MATGARTILAVAALIAVTGVTGWIISAPQPIEAREIATLPDGNSSRGENVFWASGCASCHAAPQARGDDMLLLAGGVRLETGFGSFVAPNISSHPQDGIGAWSLEDFANAVLRGISPQGEHYYPAFPYTSYARMDLQDVTDLYAFMMELPPVEGTVEGHALAFPYSVRRGLGLWKQLYLNDEPIVAVENADPQLVRGRYLVEGLGHCGECHTPRNMLGGLERDRWMAGGPSAEGGGTVPNITPSPEGIGSWSALEIALLLESGFTPEFDSVGGSMAAVVRNMARLPEEDRAAIAAYLKAIPAP